MISRVQSSMEPKDGTNLKALEKAREDLIYIRKKLVMIITEQSKLLLKQQELQKIYNEAVDELLYIGFENRMNFEDTVLKKLEDDITLSEPLIKVLRPLFKPQVNHFFNLSKALKEQRIQKEEADSTDSGILMSEKYFSNMESESEVRIRERNEKYLNIFEMICKYTMNSPNQEIKLERLLLDARKEYRRLVPDIRIFRDVLLSLSTQKEVDFQAMKQQKNTTIFNPSEEFDIKYCVLKLISQDREYEKIRRLVIETCRDKSVFVPERSTEGEAMEITKGLRCPDMIFKMEADTSDGSKS